MQSIHNSQLICLHSLISYLSPAKALLKQSRVVYKVCARIAHLYPVPLTLAPKNELPWYIKLIKPINQKWPLRPTGIDYNCQLIGTTFIRSLYTIYMYEKWECIYMYVWVNSPPLFMLIASDVSRAFLTCPKYCNWDYKDYKLRPSLLPLRPPIPIWCAVLSWWPDPQFSQLPEVEVYE